ncbi:hypothetical protein JCM8097_002677 [Rhodosporidiobolus ruineniae]
MPAVDRLDQPVLERICHHAGGLTGPLDWEQPPDYSSLRSLALVHSSWRSPAQATLAKHVRIASPRAMAAIRSREGKRALSLHPTFVLDCQFQWGIDVYWLLDRFTKGLRALKIVYDPTRGDQDGQAERDEEWLEWDVLRHPSLTGITNLFCKADFRDPADLSPLSLPISHLSLGNLPLEHSPGLHQAIFTGCKATLRHISLDFTPTLNPEKVALDSLVTEFQTVVSTTEHLVFRNKPNINFLMSLHSKMSAQKMPLFYSCTFPLLPNALAPFNILALSLVNNGTSLAELRFVEADPRHPVSEDDHEALVLRYLSAFGSRLDSFNMLGRRFAFIFPREWRAAFVRKPEIARFLDRAGARGCDVQCGAEQKFLSTAKAMEKRKGKRAAIGGGGEDGDDSPAGSDAGGPPTPTTIEEVVKQAMAQARQAQAQPALTNGAVKANGKGKGKAVEGKGKGKGKAVEKGKGKGKARAPPSLSAQSSSSSVGGSSSSMDRKGKGKAVDY